jgi:alkylated DNA nucleotide flippase Atl1
MNAEVQLARTIARALEDYAVSLEARPTTTGGPPLVVEDTVLPTARGPRQQEITEVLLGAPDAGLKTSEVAHLVKMDQANAYLALQALQKQAIAEMVPGSDPQRWRLRDRYRRRHQIITVAGLVEKGEVTTYGDISQVVYGHSQAGLAIGRVANTGTDFPNPHRVLEMGGLIPKDWTTTDGSHGVEECIRRLREEDGVEVGEANGRHFVTPPTVIIGWQELAQRMRTLLS